MSEREEEEENDRNGEREGKGGGDKTSAGFAHLCQAERGPL